MIARRLVRRAGHFFDDDNTRYCTYVLEKVFDIKRCDVVHLRVTRGKPASANAVEVLLDWDMGILDRDMGFTRYVTIDGMEVLLSQMHDLLLYEAFGPANTLWLQVWYE